MSPVPPRYRAIPDHQEDRLTEVLADLRRIETFARARGDCERAEQLGAIATAYEIEQQRRPGNG